MRKMYHVGKINRLFPSIQILVIVPLLSLLILGCGIDSYVYLAPPRNVIQNGTTLHFENDTGNDISIFRGYILLYRFFKSSEDAASSRTQIASAFSSSPTTIFLRIQNLGYNELIVNGSPYINVTNMPERSDPFSIEVSFDTRNSTGVFIDFAPSSAVVSINPGFPALISRKPKNLSSEFFSFKDSDFVENDSDLKSGQYDLDTGLTYLQCYVLSYGFSLDGLESIYSEPIWFNGSLLSFSMQ